MTTRLDSLTLNLADTDYDKLTDMTPQPGVQVNDRIAGTHYFVGDTSWSLTRAAIRE